MAVNPEPAPELEKSRKFDATIDLPGGADETISGRGEAMRRFGLPAVIVMPGGHTHSCGCDEAELTHVSPMQPDGYVYTDYRCASNYSNIFRFKVHQVRLDSRGNIMGQKEPFRAPGAQKAPKL